MGGLRVGGGGCHGGRPLEPRPADMPCGVQGQGLGCVEAELSQVDAGDDDHTGRWTLLSACTPAHLDCCSPRCCHRPQGRRGGGGRLLVS